MRSRCPSHVEERIFLRLERDLFANVAASKDAQSKISSLQELSLALVLLSNTTDYAYLLVWTMIGSLVPCRYKAVSVPQGTIFGLDVDPTNKYMVTAGQVSADIGSGLVP